MYIKSYHKFDVGKKCTEGPYRDKRYAKRKYYITVTEVADMNDNFCQYQIGYMMKFV